MMLASTRRARSRFGPAIWPQRNNATPDPETPAAIEFAQEKRVPLVVRRHAEYYRDLFEQAQSKLEARCAGEWPVDYARQLDNLRAALDWAFSPAGDASVGVALTAAAVPLWMHLSLLEECRGRVERALAALAAGASWDARHEMKLQAAWVLR